MHRTSLKHFPLLKYLYFNIFLVNLIFFWYTEYMKTCAKCNVTKPYDAFSNNKAMKDGKGSYCKLCQKEYAKQWNNKNYERKHPKQKVIGDTRHCTLCKTYKPFDAFRKSTPSWCIECNTEYDRKRNDEFRKFPRKLNKDGHIHCRNCGEYFEEEKMVSSKNGKYKGLTYCIDCSPLLSRIRLIQRYGLTLEQYHQMLEDQDYACKICKLDEATYRKRLSIDHDHSCCPGDKSCGKCVRGLLCSNCNMALGNAKDSIQILQDMIEYLKAGK